MLGGLERVYTGTMDAVMDGGPLPDINEDQPYPPHFMDAYSESKALAEQAVLGGDDENLRTVVLRACGMYGESDRKVGPSPRRRGSGAAGCRGAKRIPRPCLRHEPRDIISSTPKFGSQHAPDRLREQLIESIGRAEFIRKPGKTKE